MIDKKISFIGLGAMGGPMATNIIKKGIKLFVYDIDENKKNKVVKEGGLTSKNILDAIQVAAAGNESLKINEPVMVKRWKWLT